MKAIFTIGFSYLLFLQFGLSQISGIVYRDFNLNGLKDSSSVYEDAVIKGATIRLYGKNGLIGISLTDQKGHYVFNTPEPAPYRVELLIDKPLDFETGINNSSGGSNSSIQFVNHPSNQINFGINYPKDYNENAQLITPCYVSGNPLSVPSNFANIESLVSWNSNDGGTTSNSAKTIKNGGSATNLTILSKASEIGSCWGLAIQKKTQKLFTTATLKRHIGLGPLGIGGLYQIDLNSKTVISQIDLNSIGIPSGSVPSNVDRGLPGVTEPRSKDSLAFTLVGKVGYGGMDISENEKTIYLINLYNKKIYSIFINSPYVQPTAANVDSFAIPNPMCGGGNFRPWSIKVYRGKIYVGVVCDAQISQNTNDLKATVYELNPVTKSFSQVLQFGLNYPGFSGTSRFRPWTDNWDVNCLQGPNIYCTYPQAILTSIDFDGDDVILLGIADRYGIQGGYHQPNTDGTGFFSVISYGDILKARKSNGNSTFILENNANDGLIETAGKNTGVGPGFGEFYSGDFSLFKDGTLNETESAIGAIINIPSNKNVVITTQDPVDLYSNGVVHLNNNVGIWTKRLEIIPADVNTLIGKSSGLGDLRINSEVPPIQVGNYIWKDLNHNGIQDPIEPPMPDVEIFLIKNGNVIAKAKSNSNGQYLFSNDSKALNKKDSLNFIYGIIDLQSEENYTLRIFTNQPSLNNFLPSAFQSNFPNDSLIDNNGQIINAGQLDYNFNTGLNGQNNFSYDFGFSPTNNCALQIAEVTTSPCNPLSNSFVANIEFNVTNAPIGYVIIELSTGEKSKLFIEKDGIYKFKFQNIESRGINNVSIKISLENNTDCFIDLLNAFNQPSSCCNLNYELCSNRNQQINLVAVPGMAQYRWYRTSSSQIVGFTDLLVIDNTFSGLEDNFESYYFVAIDSSGDTVRQFCTYDVAIVNCCALNINTVLQTDCNNNGTPYNTSDDWFGVLIGADNSDAGTSSRFEVVKNNIVLGDVAYGSSILVGSAIGPDFKSDNSSIYKLVIRDFDNHSCADSIFTTKSSCPAAKLIMKKSIVSYTVLSDASYNITYKIEVENLGSETGLFNLQDATGFDDDIKIKSAFYTSNVPSKNGAALIGPGPWIIASNQLIPSFTKYTYNVIINLTIDFNPLSSGDNIYTPCGISPKSGEGLFNRALLDSDGNGSYDIADSVCAEIPVFEINKELLQTEFLDLRNAKLKYRIIIKNLGGTFGYYNLIESPSFDDDIKINSAQFGLINTSLSILPLPKPANGWVLTNQRKLNQNQIDTFNVEFLVNLDLRPGSLGDNIYKSCGSTTPNLPRLNEGMFNIAGIDLNNDLRAELKDTTCGDLPSISHEKFLWSKKIQGVDKNQVVYLFVVKNSGGATGVYSLYDQLSFDDDISILNTSYNINHGIPNSISGLFPNSLIHFIQNKSIASNSTDSIFLTFDLELNLSNVSKGDHTYFVCQKDNAGNFLPDFGLFNESQLNVNNDAIIDQRDTVCTDFEYFDLALRKTSLNVNTVKIGTNIFFRSLVFNQGTGLAKKIEITDYLTSAFDFNPILNPGWTKLNDSILTYTIDSLASLDSTFTDLVLTLKHFDDIKKTINVSEISNFLNSEFNQAFDIDSDPDQIKNNDNKVIPDSKDDDRIDGKSKLNPNEDEDDQDVSQAPIFDIALRKRLAIPGPYNYGQTIPFLITLYNQGHSTIYSATIVDYVPKGYEIDPNLNTDWQFNNSEGRLLVNDPILEGDSLNRIIYLKLLPGKQPKEYVNIAEVLNASISKRLGVHALSTDFDSEFDNDPNNDMGGKVGTLTDDEINDDGNDTDMNGIKDEDDHDPAVPFIWDLALKKIIVTKTPHLPGQKLDFVIRIFNQGTDTLGQIGLKDYISNGLQFFALDNPEWTINGTEATGIFNHRVEPGDSFDIHIYLVLKSGSRPIKEWINYAEIISSSNSLGANRTGFDIDSKEGSNNLKEREVLPNALNDDNIFSTDLLGEEDDHDPAMPSILDLALMKYVKNSNVVKYDDTATFCIDVFNQGLVSVKQISLVDYIPLGMSWVDNPLWLNVPAKRYATITLDTTLNPGDSIKLFLKLKVNTQDSKSRDLVNYTEITSARDLSSALYNRDIDSQFDFDKFNDTGGVPNSLSDNSIDDDGFDTDGDGVKDEDDQDPAMLSLVDFALRKELSPSSRASIGDTLEYIITVFNQGNIESGSISIVDYLTPAFQFIPSINTGWTVSGSNVKFTKIANLKFSDSTSFKLKLKVLQNNNPLNYCNYAEILSVKDLSGQEIADFDVDSKPNSDSPDERKVKPGTVNDNNILGAGPSKNQDEDDHDVAGIGGTAKLGDMVWNDRNANGIMELGENGIPNVQVILYDVNTLTQVKTTYTNSNGKYLFEDVVPGKYFIKFIPPTGCDISPNDQTIDTLDSDISSNFGYGTTNVIQLFSGDDDRSWDAGLYKCTFVDGYIWYDTNHNGLQELSENGINGLEVFLYSYPDKKFQSKILTYSNNTRFVHDGYYRFCVKPGTYYVVVQQLKDFLISPFQIGTNRNLDSDLNNDFGPFSTYKFTGLAGDSTKYLNGGIYNPFYTSLLTDKQFENNLNTRSKLQINLTGNLKANLVELYFQPEEHNCLAYYEVYKIENDNEQASLIHSKAFVVNDESDDDCTYQMSNNLNTGLEKVKYYVVGYDINYNKAVSNVVEFELRNTDKLTVTPNPVEEWTDIRYQGKLDNQSIIEIRDANGKLVIKEFINNASHFRLNTNILTSGFYSVVWTSGNKTAFKKMVVLH
ncbi:MAG: SdrD B-like domain-containing protein [Saprospiraceae bacterium]